MFFLLKCVLGITVFVLLAAVLRTWQLTHSADQVLFVAGAMPSPAPDGFYTGTVSGPHASWLGKTFDAANHTGINEFDAGNGQRTEGFPFKTSSGKGLRDKNLDVLKIDYDIPTNPFWVRPILDELVQVAPGHYLGKLQIRLIPGFPFTLTFFLLTR